MAAVKVLCDTGPLVAFFSRTDQYHRWAFEQFQGLSPPLWTCESVISEAIFLLHNDGLAADPLLEAIDRGTFRVEFSAAQHWPDLRLLMQKYADLPMSLADACLVRMSEITPKCQVVTTDRHFRLYRRNGRQIIPISSPY